VSLVVLPAPGLNGPQGSSDLPARPPNGAAGRFTRAVAPIPNSKRLGSRPRLDSGGLRVRSRRRVGMMGGHEGGNEADDNKEGEQRVHGEFLRPARSVPVDATRIPAPLNSA